MLTLWGLSNKAQEQSLGNAMSITRPSDTISGTDDFHGPESSHIPEGAITTVRVEMVEFLAEYNLHILLITLAQCH